MKISHTKNQSSHNYKILGVINLTPNSFSDGGVHQDQIKLLETFKKFLTINNLIIDVGFESTAPMNQAVTAEVERERFHSFIDFLKKNSDLNLKTLSIDTYKTQNFYYFYHEIKKLYPQIKIIFNDVSGVLDKSLEDVLAALPDVDYIYTYTRIPSRSVVLDHMKFLEQKEAGIVNECYLSFIAAYQWFVDRKLEKRVMFDPGFGFSKSYEENWELIENFDELVALLEKEKIHVPWVIGLSKKSFLRKKCADAVDPMAASEILHQKLLKQFLDHAKTEVYLRVHNPEILSHFDYRSSFSSHQEGR